uniref:Uncharacterized protein n=1 Tax=Chenopodium quinoa TaxID=63459 RepID=A0A803M2T0_CHEQI
MIGASSQLTRCVTLLIDFKQSFRNMDFLAAVVGALFLCYLDHLHRVPNWWSIYPKLMVWDSEHVGAVVDEDQRFDEEFGYLTILDIAYREDHSLVPRDDGDLELVFFPVLDGSTKKGDEHWWCLCIDMVKKQFWMIDSLHSDPYEQHLELVTELACLVKLCFQLSGLEGDILFSQNTGNLYVDNADSLVTVM